MNNDMVALIVFVRLPEPGKVKSRLAGVLGEKAAADFYRWCAERLFRECRKVRSAETYIFYSDERDGEAVTKWAGPGFRFAPQKGNGLGERLENALGEVFVAGAKQAIIMGSDVPDLSAGIIKEAVNGLADYNIVIGPSCDGGYYLLGMTRLHPELFKGISWSTGKVLGQTVKAADRLGLKVKRLPALRDIDTAEDLREWLKTVPSEDPVSGRFQDRI